MKKIMCLCFLAAASMLILGSGCTADYSGPCNCVCTADPFPDYICGSGPYTLPAGYCIMDGGYMDGGICANGLECDNACIEYVMTLGKKSCVSQCFKP